MHRSKRIRSTLRQPTPPLLVRFAHQCRPSSWLSAPLPANQPDHLLPFGGTTYTYSKGQHAAAASHVHNRYRPLTGESGPDVHITITIRRLLHKPSSIRVDKECIMFLYCRKHTQIVCLVLTAYDRESRVTSHGELCEEAIINFSALTGSVLLSDRSALTG